MSENKRIISKDSLEVVVDELSDGLSKPSLQKDGKSDSWDKDGQTGLHFSYGPDNFELFIDKFPGAMAKLLLEKDKDGKTILHRAAEYDSDYFKLLVNKLPNDVAKLLLEKDRYGNTVVDIARVKGNLKILEAAYPELVKSGIIKGSGSLEAIPGLPEAFFFISSRSHQ